MAEHEKFVSLEVKMPISLFEKIEAVRKQFSEGENEFYADALVKGVVIKGLEKDGLFVMAVDEERDVVEFLDNHQEDFEKARNPEEAVESLDSKVKPFRLKSKD